MKSHKIFATIGVPTLLGSFLTPVKVAPVLFVAGFGLMLMSCILVTIERYEDELRKRENENRRKF